MMKRLYTFLLCLTICISMVDNTIAQNIEYSSVCDGTPTTVASCTTGGTDTDITVSGEGIMGVNNRGIIEVFIDVDQPIAFDGTFELIAPNGSSYTLASAQEGISSFPGYSGTNNGEILNVRFRNCISLPLHNAPVNNPGDATYYPYTDYSGLNDGVTSADGTWTVNTCRFSDPMDLYCASLTFGAICPEISDVTVTNPDCPEGTGSATLNLGEQGACTDELVVYSLNGTSFNFSNTFDNLAPGDYVGYVGYVLTSVDGLSATCVTEFPFTIESNDTQAPIFTDCIESISVATDEFCQGTLLLTDPTPTDNCVTTGTATMVDPEGTTIFSATLSPGTEFTYILSILGDHIFTFTAEDGSGNSTTCQTIVTLEDITAPTWAGDNIFTITGECGVDDEQDLLDSQTALFVNNITDNCSAPEDITFSFFNSSTLLICGSSTASTYEYSLFDEAGNEASLLGIVEVTMEDNLPPVLSGVPSDVTLNCNDAFPDLPNVTASDLCEGTLEVAVTALSDLGSCTAGENAEVITYTYTSTDGCGNTVSADWQITIFNDDEVSLGPDITSCVSFTETLTTSGLSGTYLWSTGATTPTISVSTSGTYSVTVTGTSGCCSEDEITVTFDPLPNATAEGGLLDCSGNPVQLMAGSDIAGSTYAWTGPGGFTSTMQNPTVSQAGTYEVTVAGPSGVCTDLAQAEVVANTDVPDISTEGGTIDCTNDEVMLMGSSTTPDVTYLWTGPGGFTSTMQNPTVTVSGTYDLTVTAPNSCIAEGVAVVVEDLAVPTLTVTGGEIDCDNSEIIISPITNDADATYAWTGPAGFTSTMADITVDIPGDYDLTITSTNGCTNAATATVTEDVAVPNLAVSGETITCSNTEAQLTATSTTTGVTYAWSGPNGFSSTLANPTTTVAGDYAVTVEAENGCTAEGSVTVAADIATPSITAGNEELNCTTTEVQLPLTVATSNVTIAWTGPNGFTSDDQNPTVDEGGAYDVVVTASNGCTATATANVTEDIALPTASATGGSITCTSNSVQLMGTSTTGGVSFSWVGPNDFTSSIASPTVGAAGTYTLTVTAPNGCTATATAEVTADGDLPNISAMGGELTCINTSVTLSGSSTTDGVTYQWTGPGGFSSTDQTTTVATAGIYTLVVTAPNGCQSTTQINVSNDTAEPEVSTTGGMLSCTNPETTISASAADAASYAWTGPGGFTSTEDSPTVTQAGDYMVTVTGTNGCTSTATATVTSDDQLPSVVALGGTLTCENTSVILTANSSDQVTYSWTGPGGFTSALQNPIVMVPGEYILTVIAPNGCSASTTVTVDQDADLPMVSIAEPEIDCAEGTATLRVLSSDDLTYRWTYDGIVISTGEIVTISEAGTYEVLAISANGCEINLTYELEETIGSIDATVDVTDATSTQGGTAEITVAGNAVSILWDNGQMGTMASDLAAGDHTVTVTDIYGCEYTFVFTINMSTATNEIEGINSFDVYPTVTQTVITMEAAFAEAQTGHILLYDLNGRLLQNEAFSNQSTLIHSTDLSNVPSGTYLLVLSVEGNVRSAKVLKY